MGQHSRTPSSSSALSSEEVSPKKPAPGRPRLAVAVAGVAALAVASAAWAISGGEGVPARSATTGAVDAAGSAPTGAAASPTPAADPTATPQPGGPLAQELSGLSTSGGTTATGEENDSGRSDSPVKAVSAAKDKAAKDRPKAAKVQGAKATRETASAPKARVLSSGTCGASFYSEPQATASGERFNPNAMTAAHKSLPMGSKVRVTNPNTGDSVTVRINDRGPYVGGRCLDLSRAAFSAIGDTGSGVMHVKYEVLGG
ncbi:hypothetical protein GCM10010517_29970 [Streptosporangium fragile]|uniref:Probable endolytic peptidoglycan transglycosylase RlpA n=1 Tax=Streptosporangium fragile TaxID=46186 RepID=A0ABP6IFC8_9ACTN